MATVKSSNSGGFEILARRLKELDGKQAKVGWLDGNYEGGVPVAYVASIQEFGVPEKSIPARPFMRPSIAENEGVWRKTMEFAATAILKGKSTIDDAMQIIGAKAKSDIMKQIVGVTAPPLSPITIELRAMRRQGIKITGKTVGEAARKVNEEGYKPPNVSTKPLDDTGLMIDKLTYLVEDAQ
jgi:hypothetical protein